MTEIHKVIMLEECTDTPASEARFLINTQHAIPHTLYLSRVEARFAAVLVLHWHVHGLVIFNVCLWCD